MSGLTRIAKFVPQPVLTGFMNRSLIRTRVDARASPSRRIYSDAHEAALERLRSSIVILDSRARCSSAAPIASWTRPITVAPPAVRW
jgi:hypothetical protein